MFARDYNYSQYLELAPAAGIYLGERNKALLKQGFFDTVFIETAYYFYEDFSLFPKLGVLENSISEDIKSYSKSCFEELRNITEITEIDYKIENVTTKIIKDSIIVDAYIPTKLKSVDTIYEIEKFCFILK